MNPIHLFKAEDTDAKLERVHCHIEAEDKDWLKSLEGGVALHIRAAVRMYRESKNV